MTCQTSPALSNQVKESRLYGYDDDDDDDDDDEHGARVPLEFVLSLCTGFCASCV